MIVKRLLSIALAIYATSSFAGENTKPVVINCKNRNLSAYEGLRGIALGNALLEHAIQGKKVINDRVIALGRLDSYLGQGYELKQPLSMIEDEHVSMMLGRTAQMVFSGYVVAAEMSHGLMLAEKKLPLDVTGPVSKFVYALLEPDDEDQMLPIMAERVLSAQKRVEGFGVKTRPYARWVLRGYGYNDPVAVSAGIDGFCKFHPTKEEIRFLTQESKRIRLIPGRGRSGKDK